jgi:hypothetical protein
MTPLAGYVFWGVEIVLIAAMSGRRRGARLGFILATVLLPLPFAVIGGHPFVRAFLAMGFLWCFIRGADFMLEPSPARFGARLMHLFSAFDTRLVTRRGRRFDSMAAARLTLMAGIAAGSFLWLRTMDHYSPWLRYLGLALVGGVMIFAAFESLVGFTQFLTQLLGVNAPPLNDAPYRSRSLSEFWARRWNLVVAKILRERCFRPFARKGVAPSLLLVFAVSGAAHVYTIGAALGSRAALSWAVFFLAQPVLIGAERWLGVRRWPHAAGMAWTGTTLAVVLPFFVAPALRLV